jgi:hypothetical protein
MIFSLIKKKTPDAAVRGDIIISYSLSLFIHHLFGLDA